MINLPITSFNSGEFSPWMDGRIDLEKYRSGCRICENFLIETYGGVRRRPGLEYVAALRDETESGRLIPFRFSTEDSYVMVFNDTYLRVYSGGATPSQVGAEILSPYLESELFRIQYAQQNDVVYLCHPDHPVYKLIRTTSTTFTLEEADWEWSPVRNENRDEDVTAAFSSITGSGITMTGVGTDWDSSFVGSRFRIAHERPGDSFEVTNTQITGSSDEIRTQSWNFSTEGTWTGGTIYVEKYDEDAAAWESVREYEMAGRNVSSASGTFDEITRMRVRHDLMTGSHYNSVLEARDGEPFGEVEITAVASATSATVTVRHDLYSTDATDLWSEGAFSDHSGHPQSATFFEGRLILGGTELDAQTIWGSASDEYDDFSFTSEGLDDESYRHNLAANEYDRILWMVSERRLIIGTSGGEFVIGSADDSVVVTPKNVRGRRHSNYGSDAIQAVFVNDSVIYAQRHGRKVREYGYSFERDRYQASDITVLAEHITGDGLIEFAYQQQRNAILWGVTEGGMLVGLTYEREQSVVGWHKHSTDGLFESVETIYGDGEEDEVWVIVRRTIDGASRRFIERMEPTQYKTMQDEDKESWFYVDSGKSQSGVAMTAITNLSHLEGETVDLLADGIHLGEAVVSGGAAALPNGYTASTVVAGLKMTSRLEPMKLEASLGNGTSRTREGRINRVGIVLWHSLGGYIGEDGVNGQTEDMDPLLYRDTDDEMDNSPDPKTGEFEFDLDSDYREGVTLGIVCDQPYPFAVLMLVPKFQVFGDSE